eukprot:SAG11_NODE_457_length_9306_cov_2.887803_3_plen_68_part_00
MAFGWKKDGDEVTDTHLRIILCLDADDFVYMLEDSDPKLTPVGRHEDSINCCAVRGDFVLSCSDDYT